MKIPISIPRIKSQINSRTVFSLLIAESILLSLFHHVLNFWGLPWDKQALLILILAPAFSILISYLLRPIWEDCLRIQRNRWLLFLLPTLVIGSFVTWRLFSLPEIQHQLTIIPNLSSSADEIQLEEIKAAYGNVIPLSNFTNLKGWALHDGLLIGSGPAAQPIHYSFYGPINQLIRVTFETSPKSGSVEVVLDGKSSDLDLKSSDGNQKRTKMDTQYGWGPLNIFIIPIIVISDLFTVVLMLGLMWVMQEINKNRAVNSRQSASEKFLSHSSGLLILCSFGLILHIINFLAVPLAVIKDSPSYLQGAVYWISHHSLDGVSSYRGPGTTFLFTPFMAVFGRNPWSLKILLHLLAFGCVPISYRLGWQLGKRRWFAFFTGLIAVLIPDLYFYSNFVLSEVPHFFFVLLFSTLFLSALETMALGWLIAALLVGAFSVLVRSESAIPLMIGVAFIFIKVIWDWKNQKPTGIQPQGLQHVGISALWRVGLAIIIAAIPLLAWSVHNLRVYRYFGISDYGGAVLFDGWIYFGESSRIPITNPDSPAVRAINAVYPAGLSNTTNVPTPWAIYYLLLDHGYTSEQAFSILGQASIDSIRNDIPLSIKLLEFKIQKSLEPQVLIPATFLFPGEKANFEILNSDYFDKETLFLPGIINLQRSIDAVVGKLYEHFYSIWVWLCLGMSFICLYRKPFFQYVPLVVLAVSSLFLPITLGMSQWRYVLTGIFLIQLFVLAGIQSIGEFLPYYLTALRQPKEIIQ